MPRMLRKSQDSKLFFCWAKWMLLHCYIQIVEDEIQIRVYNVKESETCFCQFISVKVKKILRKFQAQFWES